MERTVLGGYLADTVASSIKDNRMKAFLAIGRETAWDDDSLPPIDISSLNAEKSFRDDVWGLKQIEADEVSLVCPRIDWQIGTTYAPADPSDRDLNLRNYYVLTDENRVFKCVESGSGTSTFKPSLSAISPQTLSDGYTWQFLYEISVSQANTFLNDIWIPVPSAKVGNRGVLQTNVEENSVWVPGAPMVGVSGGHGSYAAYELPCRHVMLSCRVTGLEGGAIENGRKYRQVGLWLDPRGSSSGLPFNLSNYGSDGALQTISSGRTPTVVDGDLNSITMERYSGEILYLENRSPVTKASDQNEHYRLVIRL